MTTSQPPHPFRRGALALAALMILLSWIGIARPDDPTAPVSPERVREMLGKYKAERAEAEKQGLNQIFSPEWYERADRLAKQAEENLAAGKSFEAWENVRQARWDLPTLPANLTTGVKHILGDARLRHAGAVQAVAFSPDGTRLATAGKDGVVIVWDVATGRQLVHHSVPTLFQGEKIDLVACLAFSPDGKWIASGGCDKTIKIWETETGKEVKSFDCPQQPIRCIAFKPDGQQIACGEEKHVRVYDLPANKLQADLPNAAAAVNGVAFSRDGKLLAVVSADGFLRIYDGTNGSIRSGEQRGQGELGCVAFSPDGQSIAIAGKALSGAKLLTLTDRSEKQNFSTSDSGPATCFAFSKDGKTLATGGADGILRLFDVASGQVYRTIRGHAESVRSVALSPDGLLLASASDDQSARLWDLRPPDQGREYVGHTDAVWSAVFSPDGKSIVSAGADKTLRIWKVGVQQDPLTLKGHLSAVTAALFSPDGKYVLSCSGDKTMKLWDATTGKEIQSFVGHTGTVTSAAFNPDGSQIVSGSTDRTVRIWDTSRGTVVKESKEHPAVICAVAWSPDGKKIASGGGDLQIKIWDAAALKVEKTLSEHTGAVSSLAFSPDSLKLVSGGGDRRVIVWSLAGPTKPLVFTGHSAVVSSVAFSPDGLLVASGGGDQIVRVWSTAQGNSADAKSKETDAGKAEVNSFRGHKNWITSVAFSPKGKSLVSASVDKTLRVWTVGGESTEAQAPVALGHKGEVDLVVISADGKWIASAGLDRSIRIWDAATGKAGPEMVGSLKALTMMTFTADGKFLVTASVDNILTIWDVATGKELRKAEATPSTTSVSVLTMSGDASGFLCCFAGLGNVTIIQTYDAATGKRVAALPPKDILQNVRCLDASADGGMVALGAVDGTVRFIDLVKKTKDGEDLKIASPELLDLVLSLDKKVLASVHKDGSIQLWDVPGRKLIHPIPPGKDNSFAKYALSRDGKQLATVGADNLIKLWDTESGKETHSWDLHYPVQKDKTFVHAVAFSADGKQLLMANSNSTLYCVATGK